MTKLSLKKSKKLVKWALSTFQLKYFPLSTHFNMTSNGFIEIWKDRFKTSLNAYNDEFAILYPI